MMSGEIYDFYQFLKRWFFAEWLDVKSRQPRQRITFTDWENNKNWYALKSFNNAASLEFSLMFDELIPLDVDRWYLNTAYFETDKQGFDYVVRLQDRLNTMIQYERSLIR